MKIVKNCTVLYLTYEDLDKFAQTRFDSEIAYTPSINSFTEEVQKEIYKSDTTLFSFGGKVSVVSL